MSEKLCPDCRNKAHEPGMSEFSNCGESEISHSKNDQDYYVDPSVKKDRLEDEFI